jgi:transcriptional regulator with XRE-family HTH domain
VKALLDLHPDDLATRRRLAADLRAARVAAGLSHSDLANRLGIRKADIGRMETRLTWRMDTLYRRARAISRVLALSIDGRPVNGFGAADLCSQAMSRIVVARACAGLTEADIADRLGVTPQAVRMWDRCTNPTLVALQRHARAADVPLTVALELPDAAV